jgi:two-component system NtrC family sensor kinase
MSRFKPAASMLSTPFLRPVWFPTVVTGFLLLVALGLLVGMSWQSLRRLESVQAELAKLSLLQRAALHLEELLIGELATPDGVDEAAVRQVRQELEQIQPLERGAEPETAKLLNAARLALSAIEVNPRDALVSSLTSISRVVEIEDRAHEKLVAEARRDTEFEFRIATSTLVVLPLVALVTLFLLRRRIFEPITRLGSLLDLLARQDYSPAAAHAIDPFLKPLYENYNRLVSRLTELEDQNRARQQSLENQVRAATHALLEQQRELAAAERLAAVGEVAAGLAHELRNPLAGIQMALNNLSREISDPDHGKRLALVINELNRMTGLLNGMLSQTRQEPETVREIQLASAVGELLTLVSYQISPNIRLEQEIPAQLVCRLPAGGLHQALLNLVLNAAQAIGRDGGKIMIRAAVQDGAVMMSVCDDGPGFPPTMLQGGIRPFASGRVGGTGLGLAIVQRFVGDLGGAMALENQAPRGACVTMTLPCRCRHG